MIDFAIKATNRNKIDISNFTKDQLNAYNDLIKFIDEPFDSKDYKRALVGAAGTGKTYLVKSLILNSALSYSLIGLSAPTHKACRVLGESINIPGIHANTLQSDLGLRLNFDIDKFDPNNPPFDPKGQIKIKQYKIYIVDEASMINRSLRDFLERTCVSFQCKIIYIGDESQLPPVGEFYSSALRGIKTNRLTQIVRQGDDNPVSELLELLRYDIKHNTFEFLKRIQQVPAKYNLDDSKGYQVCNEDKFKELICINFRDEELTTNIDYAKVVAYTNNKVSYWNKYIRNNIIEDCEKSIITKNDLIISYTTLVNDFNDAIIKNSEEYIIKDIVNYTESKYGLKGFMIKFQAIHGGNVTTPLFVIDHSDTYSIMKYDTICESLITAAKSARSNIRAQRWKDFYTFKDNNLLLTNILYPTGKIKYERNLDYGFALTSHKSQGSTFKTVFVDVKDIVYDKYGQPYAKAEDINRRLYVACSRCKDKLYLNW